MSRFRIRRREKESGEREEKASQYIGMRLGAEEYVIDIVKVREIIMLEAITYVPRVAGHFEGVINLRGDVVPVVNLRVKLGMPDAPFTQRTRIIVTEAGKGPVGILVDAVTNVVRFGESAIKPATAALGDVAAEYLKGIARTGTGIVGLIDIDRLVA